MLLYGYYGYYWDPTYILVLIGAVISLIASARVNSAFNKYQKVRSYSGMTGAMAAQTILNYAGIHDVTIERVSGHLSDHYDPKSKVLRLSDATYGDTSVAAIGVAAHECGHAIQHNEGYGPLVLRSTLVPVANIGSKLGIPIILLGVLLSYNYTLIQVGIWVFAIAVFFQIVTLPVEFNASNRATKLLGQYQILNPQEIQGCKKVLGAAAMTYVAAAASAILSLLRLILLFGRRNND
ncbi:MAG: zinc metallopeptidase [Lachnospiraceae bacterium]|nr:zinc metallopeptidase [Lachnospiraceae bacterium]MBR2401726.1 zinc metallopeptidase [Lachnospiraceae bacterium]